MRAFLVMVLASGLALLSALGGDQVSIQSYNLPDHFIRHRDGAAELALFESDFNPADFCFKKVKGLDGTESISFESKNFPGKFLRHKGFRIFLDANDGGEVFKKDASFRIVPGLADPSCSSFESVNNQGFYLRHKNFRLLLESGEDFLFLQDCTFTLSSPLE